MAWKVRAYYNVNPFIGLSWHDTMVPVPIPPFMIPGKLPHLDFGVVQGLWIGSFLSNGKDRTVLSDDLLYVGRMSDAGLVVPHISFPPSWYNLLTTLFGSSNALFGCTSVTVACKNLLWGNDDCDLATSPFPVAPVSINLSCWDPISLPSDVVVVWGTTYAGMSFADLLAALVDFAIQVCIEGLMWLGGKMLTAGIKKIGASLAKKGGKEAGKKVVKQSVKKGVFATLGEKIVSGIKKATGATPSAAYKSYLEKAANVKGVKLALDMSDDDLAKFVKKTGGFSDELGEVAENFTEGYKKFGNKYGKQVKGLNKATNEAESVVKKALLEAKSFSSVDDKMAVSIVKEAVLTDALEELDAIVKRVGWEEVVFSMEVKLLTKSLSTLYKNIIRNGQALGEGTEGGIFSFEGAGWTSFFDRTLLLQDRMAWDAAQDYISFGEAVVDAFDDDDYWFERFQESSTDSEEEDDDYWYESDESATSSSVSAE